MDGWQEEYGLSKRFSLGLPLQEVVWCLTSHMRFPAPWGWVKLKEGILEGIIELHDGSLVAATVAVVWRRENGHHIPVVRPVVPLHHQLVGPGETCSGPNSWNIYSNLEMSVRPFEWLKVSEMSWPNV